MSKEHKEVSMILGNVEEQEQKLAVSFSSYVLFVSSLFGAFDDSRWIFFTTYGIISKLNTASGVHFVHHSLSRWLYISLHWHKEIRDSFGWSILHYKAAHFVVATEEMGKPNQMQTVKTLSFRHFQQFGLFAGYI